MTPMTTPFAATLVVETYNLIEGTDRDRFREALRTAVAAAEAIQGEVLVTDACGGEEVRRIVAAAAPRARILDAVGLSYDQAKMLAAAEAAGEAIVYLDSDCEPVGRWPGPLLDALAAAPEAAGVGGFTRYRGDGVVAAVMSVMDFGFLLPLHRRPLACYAFNNAAFHRDALVQCPVPEGRLRCGCFAHAQRLLRQGTPMLLAPKAIAIHDLPPIVRERTRQGHDTIAACWENSALPEARFLWLGVFSLPLFWAMRVTLDWRRLLQGSRDLGLSLPGLGVALVTVPLLRLLDAGGMLHAFAVGRGAPAWGGWEPQTARH
jgi:hypothetical protein